MDNSYVPYNYILILWEWADLSKYQYKMYGPMGREYSDYFYCRQKQIKLVPQTIV